MCTRSNCSASTVLDDGKEGPVPLWPWTHTLAVHDLIQQPSLPSSVELPVEILPHLLLGDVRSARRVEHLKSLGVTHVLNVAGRQTANVDIDYVKLGMEHVSIDAEDREGYPMLPLHLSSARAFIQEALEAGGRCLVHCRGGVNRSGVVVAAELMLREQIPVLEAVNRCKEVRGLPYLSNRSFQYQLVKLAEQEHLLGPRPAGCKDGPSSPAPPAPPPRAAPPPTARRYIATATSPIHCPSHSRRSSLTREQVNRKLSFEV
mmetsp:Transcript_22898/g.41542  ORF Transcript_22898/g.41542 Transcript_22898/m.41542 type:complete len:261 (-) Transcript_22898:144-926(-)